MTRPNEKTIPVLCFGGEDWWYHNRGHIDMQLMRRFAKCGTVLYVNSIVLQKPNLAKGTGGGRSLPEKVRRKFRSLLRGLQKSDAGFWVYSPLSFPLHHSAIGRRFNRWIVDFQVRQACKKIGMQAPMVWVACPAACDVAVGMAPDLLIYQRTDRFDEYPNVDVDAVRRYDRTLKESADLTVFVSQALYDEEAGQCKRALYLDHGVDFDLFAGADQDKCIPPDLKEVKHPIVGFFGGIDSHTSDIPFMEEVVRLLPEYSFVFVGKASSDVTGLLNCPNVWMVGQKSYEQVPHYGKCFDVAIMVWQQNRWIAGCNPIKLKEYLALGKPVVSTPFLELHRYLDIVYEARTPREFAEQVERAWREDDPSRVAARRARVRAYTWDLKARTVLAKISSNSSLLGDRSSV